MPKVAHHKQRFLEAFLGQPADAPKVMPKPTAPLTEMQVRKAKPADKPYRLADGKGLYLEVMPNGSRYCKDTHCCELLHDALPREAVRDAMHCGRPRP